MKRRFVEDSYRKEPWFRALCSAVLANRSEEDIANFLRDIGTLSELQAWSERLEIAQQLSQGKSYREIAKATGASTTTVTRVAQFLENGAGGYRKVLHAHRHHRIKKNTIINQEEPYLEAKNMSTLIDHGNNKSVPEKPDQVLQKYLGKKIG